MPEYGYFLSRVMQPVSPAAGESGYFSSPEDRLDPRLFDGERIKPSVRTWILNTLYTFWGDRYRRPRDWSTVWIAGSGISYQWAAGRGNGDLDILIGVDYDEFFEANPRFVGLDETDLAAIFNEEFHTHLWPSTAEVVINTKGEVWVGRRLESAPAAPSNRSTPEASAQRVSGGTNGTGISSGSTGSTPPSTTDFWKNRVGSAGSAAPTSPVAGMGSSASTMTMNQDEFGAFSASTATTPSESSGTPPSPSSGSSSTSEGIFEVTWYVNAGATDIRNINPYAAYDLSADEWTVRPPTGDAFTHPKAYYEYAENEAKQARSIVDQYNSVASQAKASNPGSPGWHNAMRQAELLVGQASTLYDSIHLGRKQAFGPGGSGYGDYYNFRWQYHKKNGTAQALHAVAAAHKDARSEYNTAMYGGAIDAADVVLRRAVMANRSRS